MGLIKVEITVTTANLGVPATFTEAFTLSGMTDAMGLATMTISNESAVLPVGNITSMYGLFAHVVSAASTNALYLWQSASDRIFSSAGALRLEDDQSIFVTPGYRSAADGPWKARTATKSLTFQWGIFGT